MNKPNTTTMTSRPLLALTMIAGTAAMMIPSTALAQDSDYSNLPDQITLTGTVRDFNERTVAGGHTDFEFRPSGGFGHYMGIVSDYLNENDKPVFNSTGYKVSSNWTDANGRKIIQSKDYIAPREGDHQGSLGSAAGAIHDAASLDQWFRNVPGVNVSKPLDLTLVRQAGSNVYVFDDKRDATYASLGGFFPINGDLFGNSANNNKNFHFTFELQTEFSYEEDSGQVFTFTGDDDVWVFVDGRLVIDIGGVHSAVSQTIELDRLDWLEDGQRYKLSFFFAERHRTQSNFRIETTMQLRTVQLPPTAALYD
ncbi:MAG: fibro-slime domain-containing protein [Phycisphaerales bacterium]|nr:fibro-slime domain-containing protein [Phycisphaerales bacterium]